MASRIQHNSAEFVSDGREVKAVVVKGETNLVVERALSRQSLPRAGLEER